MPALSDYSKEFIIEKLLKVIHGCELHIEELEKENARLTADMQWWQNKAEHGCTGMPCPECDEPKKRETT
jgi:hypothetical protein